MLLEIIHQIVAAKPHVQYAVASLLLPAAMAAAPSIYKGIAGLIQAKSGKIAEKKIKRPELNIPVQNIPGQVTDVTKNVKLAALDTSLPGADIMKSEIDADTAGAITRAQESGTSSSDILNTIAAMGAQGSRAKRGINLEGAKRYDEMQSDVNRALMTEAGYENQKQALDREKYMQEFTYNKDQPYQSEAATISALRGAANQNIYSSINDLASLGTTLAMQGAFKGTPKTNTTTTTGYQDNTSVSEMPADIKAQLYPQQAPAQYKPTWMNIANQVSPMAPPAPASQAPALPFNTAGMGAGRLSNQIVTATPPPTPQTTMQQSMMGQYFPPQQGGSYNYITGVPGANLAPVKPSWYYTGANPYYMYNYLSNPSGQNYNGAPFQSAVGPREQ
jgi:hypothetical protein